ncbi:hypothetical protein ASD15_17265 [Massilia sp. Root351]|jgi:hypothetical protein|uniref:hypothetical protein n=1 Tax=Massilia sp. Root351 TaxID=1736522 RepID=UPI00070D1AB5|nr:hypothetical protein [Massilia sp. Root351]KQV79781.1 hypothetical protein ASD15_17265 [Massilia sp. Root351]
MSPDQLAYFSGWASIIGLAVSLASLSYVRSIKANIIKFRRRLRLQQVCDDVLDICHANQLRHPKWRGKVASLKGNLPIHVWHRFTPKGRAIITVHCFLDAGDAPALVEALEDLRSYSEDL